MLFTHFYIIQGKKLETCFVLPASRKYFDIELIFFLSTNRQIDYSLAKWTAKYFFHRCSYKYSCFNELVYNSNVFLRMVCSLKDILKELALDFLFLFWKLAVSLELCCHIASYHPSKLPLEILQILVSFPLWIKLIMGPLLHFFIHNF